MTEAAHCLGGRPVVGFMGPRVDEYCKRADLSDSLNRQRSRRLLSTVPAPACLAHGDERTWSRTAARARSDHLRPAVSSTVRLLAQRAHRVGVRTEGQLLRITS